MGKQRLQYILFFLFVGLYTGCQPEKIKSEGSVEHHDTGPSLQSQNETCSAIFQQVLSIIKTIQEGGLWREEKENLVYDSTAIHAQNSCGDFLQHVIINFLSGLQDVKNGKEAKNKEEKKDAEELDACYKAVIEFFKLLIKEGAVDLNKKDRYEKTALEAAAEYTLLEVCILIMDSGDIDSASVGKAMVAAASGGHVEVLKLFIPFIKDSAAFVPVLRKAFVAAAQGGHVEVLKLLIPFIKDSAAFVPVLRKAFVTAAQGGHVEVLKLFIPFIKDSMTFLLALNNSLRVAAKYGHLDICKLLLNILIKEEENTSLTSLRTLGRAIVVAIRNNRQDVFEVLMHNKVGRECSLNQALFVAARYNDLESCQFFVSSGATDFDWPTFIAAKMGHSEVLRWLIVQAKTHSVVLNLDSLLEIAVGNCHAEACQLLVDYGASDSYLGVYLFFSVNGIYTNYTNYIKIRKLLLSMYATRVRNYFQY